MSYVPEVGDIIWLEFDPQAGHEQAGHRPAVVLTPKTYNQIVSIRPTPIAFSKHEAGAHQYPYLYG